MNLHPYFFDQGICFQCQQCGRCCVGEPGTIYVTADEVERLADHFRLSVADFTSRYLYPFKDSHSIREDDRGHCVFFDNGCTIYPLRPGQCRTFPFWFSNLRSESRWREIEKACPGIGKGRRFSRDEILCIVRETLRI